MKKQKNNLITKPTKLYEEARKRYQDLLAIREELEASLSKAPPGKIHVAKSAKRTQFYLREDGLDKTGKYIPKADTSTIKAHLQKAYDEKELKLLNIEISSLENLLKHSDGIIKKQQILYSNNPTEVKNYISPIDVSDEDYGVVWLNTPYVGKEINPQLPYFETRRKERVRSKSEIIIANALAAHGIPYKYECPLKLSDGNVIYPDFTVLNVKERREIYWEHRGMMDDKQYSTASVMRFKAMNKDGIILGMNLIITEETTTSPLGTKEVEMIINKYFLQ